MPYEVGGVVRTRASKLCLPTHAASLGWERRSKQSLDMTEPEGNLGWRIEGRDGEAVGWLVVPSSGGIVAKAGRIAAKTTPNGPVRPLLPLQLLVEVIYSSDD